MANDLNQCNFIGHLGADPEIRYMPDGNPVCNFRIAVGKSYKRKDGEKVDDTQWVPIIMFRGLADVAAKYLTKGKQVFISGEWKTREWEDKKGNRRWTTEIIANNMQMLGKASKNEGQGGYQDRNQPKQVEEEGLDDDIPF